jgi:chromosome condensin MukBEF complex kleisin-like MukF subunit
MSISRRKPTQENLNIKIRKMKRQYIKKPYYFTFGQAHRTLDGVPMRDYHVLVRAENEEVAREIFIEKFTKVRMPSWNMFFTSYQETHFKPEFFPLGEYARFEQE